MKNNFKRKWIALLFAAALGNRRALDLLKELER